MQDNSDEKKVMTGRNDWHFSLVVLKRKRQTLFCEPEYGVGEFIVNSVF